MDSKELQDHRLGIYDWMQRCNKLVFWILMNGAMGITLKIEDSLNYKLNREEKKLSSVNSPGNLTYFPRLMNPLLQMVGAIAAYPINQLDKIDDAEMTYSRSHPDSTFFGSWYSWVIELFVRMVQSVVGAVNPSHDLLNGSPVSL